MKKLKRFVWFVRIAKIVAIPLIVIVIVVFIMVDSMATSLYESYISLSSKISDSKVGYDKKLYYVSTDENGKSIITVGFQSEAEMEAQQQKFADIWKDGEEDDGKDGKEEKKTTFTLTLEEEKVKDALSSTYGDKAVAMAKAYSYIVSTFDNPAMAVGLMANIACEGDADVVEYAFSTSHHWGFDLPDGHDKITTIDDIDYLLNWDSSTETKCSASNCSGGGTHGWKKGSCGCGYIQWSFGRRITFLNKLKSLVNTDADLTEENFHLANSAMFQHELTPSTSYYTSTSSAVSSADKDSPEVWAEAFCEKYVKPSGKCNSMNGSGVACAARRGAATTIASLLEGVNE